MKKLVFQHIICCCLFFFPFGVLADSCPDDERFVPSATAVHTLPDIVPSPRILEGTIVGERADRNVFLDVDTLR